MKFVIIMLTVTTIFATTIKKYGECYIRKDNNTTRSICGNYYLVDGKLYTQWNKEVKWD